MPEIVELVIDRLGAAGDGVARHQGRTVYVPFTLPGERVAVRLGAPRGDGVAGRLDRILAAAPGRTAPACPHFGICGGCAIQHVAGAAAADWKRGLLVAALGRAGADAGVVAPLLSIPPGRRRRAALGFRRTARGTVLGFAERGSHRLVDLERCPALLPALEEMLAPLRELLGAVAVSGRADLLATETGLDLLVEAADPPDLAARERLVEFGARHDLARLSWAATGQVAEPVIRRRPAVVRLGGVAVEPPPGGFLQPSAEGEATLVTLVAAAVDAGPVLDLHAGCGSFSFPLALRHAVHAVEGDPAALEALERAARLAGARVDCERRDLDRDPVAGRELSRFRAAVFDPPRAGAAAQAKALAEAGPPTVVAVSCNPATLARDARLLLDGGYRLERATPVDQFPWAADLEAVAVFRR